MKRGETNRRACFFLGLVVIARAKHPVPSRTRPLSAVAPMVLRLKTWESRSPPNLERNTKIPLPKRYQLPQSDINGAGWSSPVARQAHNLKAAGSNPAPATNKTLPKPPHAVAFVYVAASAKSRIDASAPHNASFQTKSTGNLELEAAPAIACAFRVIV